jgi:hypothetical protein
MRLGIHERRKTIDVKAGSVLLISVRAFSELRTRNMAGKSHSRRAYQLRKTVTHPIWKPADRAFAPCTEELPRHAWYFRLNINMPVYKFTMKVVETLPDLAVIKY